MFGLVPKLNLCICNSCWNTALDPLALHLISPFFSTFAIFLFSFVSNVFSGQLSRTLIKEQCVLQYLHTVLSSCSWRSLFDSVSWFLFKCFFMENSLSYSKRWYNNAFLRSEGIHPLKWRGSHFSFWFTWWLRIQFSWKTVIWYIRRCTKTHILRDHSGQVPCLTSDRLYNHITRCMPHLTHAGFNKGVLVPEKAQLLFSSQKWFHVSGLWSETQNYLESNINYDESGWQSLIRCVLLC